jgi:hypothetical protein
LDQSTNVVEEWHPPAHLARSIVVLSFFPSYNNVMVAELMVISGNEIVTSRCGRGGRLPLRNAWAAQVAAAAAAAK